MLGRAVWHAIFWPQPGHVRGFPPLLVVKNPHASAGDTRHAGSIPELGRYPGGGNCTPLQNSCLGNPMDRGDWGAIATRSQKSWIQLGNSTATPPPTKPHRNGPRGSNTSSRRHKGFTQPVLDLLPTVWISFPIFKLSVCFFSYLRLSVSVRHLHKPTAILSSTGTEWGPSTVAWEEISRPVVTGRDPAPQP